MIENFMTGTLTIEVKVKDTERLLNILWTKNINISNITKIDITTLKFNIDYEDFEAAEEVVKKNKGKIKIIKRFGRIFVFRKIKNKIAFVLGAIVFMSILYILSTHIWAIDINTNKNIAPFEIRSQLKELGVIPGITQSNINVYELEKKLENDNSNILWIRARIEGAILKITVEEKVNPPGIHESSIGDCTASMDGEIKRVYVTSGTAVVGSGDIVKAGDVLIKAVQGREGEEYETPASGTIIANTFYEKEMEIKISGTELKRTANEDKEIYIEVFNKKIYFKKAVKNFEYYDKIEEGKNFIKTVTYYEKKESEVNVNKEDVIKDSILKLQEALLVELKNNAIVTSKSHKIQEINDGKIRLNVMFVVEQEIGVSK